MTWPRPMRGLFSWRMAPRTQTVDRRPVDQVTGAAEPGRHEHLSVICRSGNFLEAFCKADIRLRRSQRGSTRWLFFFHIARMDTASLTAVFFGFAAFVAIPIIIIIQ